VSGPAGIPTTSSGTLPAASVPTVVATTTTTTTVKATTTTVSQFARPEWLGTRLLPLRDDEFGEVQPTPPELVDRRLETIDLLPPPVGSTFVSSLGPVPADVLERSTWTEECPVTVDDLVYITVSHHGFDRGLHTGEMIVNAAFAEDVVDVFHRLFDAGFPLEQVRVIDAWEVDAHPTGDWNDTTSFVCRPAVGSGSWSQHAFGLAIDVNPFHNPYVKGDLVLPELASAYADRTRDLPGMIVPGDPVVSAFAELGWGWGGEWNSLKDYMHFSSNGR
jgi:hypothetical protein